VIGTGRKKEEGSGWEIGDEGLLANQNTDRMLGKSRGFNLRRKSGLLLPLETRRKGGRVREANGFDLSVLTGPRAKHPVFRRASQDRARLPI